MKKTSKITKENVIEEDKMQEDIDNQYHLRKLEEFYVTGTINDMLKDIEKQKNKISDEIIEYANTHQEPVFNRNGDIIDTKVIIKPVVIQNYFFKSICPLNCQMPEYNAEKLALVYDYYCYIIAEVNDKIGAYPSSLSSFCKLASITTATLRNYRNSSDLAMRTIAEKIYDEIGEANLTMGQLGVVNERSTVFRLKAQHDMVEKVQPRVNINIVEKPDMESINKQLSKYKEFAEKRG